MKKFLCVSLLMLSVLMAQAAVQKEAYSPPENTDQCMVSLSIDGVSVASFDQVFTIVEWQAPVMLNMEVSEMSAQAVETNVPALQVVNSETPVCLRWPICRQHERLSIEARVADVYLNYFADSLADT